MMRRRRVVCSAILQRFVFLGALALSACGVSQAVHQPLDYPETPVHASEVAVRVEDHRLDNPPGPSFRIVPESFAFDSQERVRRLVTGAGRALQVIVSVEQIDEVQLVDSRGEMTRLSVDLRIAVRTSEGKGLLSGDVHSQVDVPRREATEEEIQRLVLPTSLNAFDRFWVSNGTIERLNRAIQREHSRQATSQ